MHKKKIDKSIDEPTHTHKHTGARQVHHRIHNWSRSLAVYLSLSKPGTMNHILVLTVTWVTVYCCCCFANRPETESTSSPVQLFIADVTPSLRFPSANFSGKINKDKTNKQNDSETSTSASLQQPVSLQLSERTVQSSCLHVLFARGHRSRDPR